MACVQQLPDEVLASILSLVAAANGEDLLQTRLICRQWRAASARASMLTWRIYGENDVAALTSFLLSDERRGIELSNLSLVFSQEAVLEVCPKLLFASLKHLLPQKVSLRSSGSDAKLLGWSKRREQGPNLSRIIWTTLLCQRVKELQIKGRYEAVQYSNPHQARPLLTKLTKIRLIRLDISNARLEGLFAMAPVLESLEWEDLIHVKQELIVKSSSLKHLSGKQGLMPIGITGEYPMKVVADNLETLDVDYGPLTLHTPNLHQLSAPGWAIIRSGELPKLPKLLALTVRGCVVGGDLLALLVIIKGLLKLQRLDISLQEYLEVGSCGMGFLLRALPSSLQRLHLDKELLETLQLTPASDSKRLELVTNVRVYNLTDDDPAFAHVYANLRSLVRACPRLEVLELSFVVDSTKFGAFKSLVREDFKSIPVVAVSVQR